MKKTAREALMEGSVKHADLLKEKMKNPAFVREYRKQLLAVEVAEILYAMREKKQMTQRELGERAGLKQAAVARIEAGELNLTLKTIGRLAAALDCAVSLRMRPLRA